MATPREKDAAEYVKKHKIIELMDNMTSMLLFYRPEDPREFLIKQLEQLKTSRSLVSEGQICSTAPTWMQSLGYWIPLIKKYITFAQYKQALTMLGINDINECPDGVNEDRISHETFKTEAMEGLQRTSATYAQL